MVRAAEKYKRVVQVGQWQRSDPHWQDAMDFVHSGKLGKIRTVRVFSYQGWCPSIPVKPDEAVPAGVDYDIIGLSYYPFWHGDLKQLSKTLSTLATRFPDKPVQIVETAYYYNYFPENNPSYTNTTGTWPATSAGQSAFVVDLCAELVKHDNVTGLYYWFPEENGSGGAYWSEANTVLATWINRGFWDNSTHKLNSGILKMQEFLTGKEAAGIDGVVQDGESADEDAPIYNLSGQRIDAVTVPGIYIQKGKKMLKK